MATLTPAAIQNENIHIHREKGVDGVKLGIVQNENIYIHKGKGLEGFKAEVPKPKTGRQERKALRDLSQKPVLTNTNKSAVLKNKSIANKGMGLKEKSTLKENSAAKKASKSNILTDEEIAKCREWAEEGIEHMHFSGNDMHKFEVQQQEERVKKKVDKAMYALRAWNDITPLGLQIPVKDVLSDNEDNLLLEFEPEMLPPTPRSKLPPKPGSEEIDYLFELDYDSLYCNHHYEMKLKEEEIDDLFEFDYDSLML